jgi:hypothetical protein
MAIITEIGAVMNIKIRLVTIAISLSLMSGCVAYAPYPAYSERPYGGYGYGYAPVVPLPTPMFHGGWGYRGDGHHHRH